MQYMLLIYQPPGFDAKALPPEQHAQIAGDYQAVSRLPEVTPGLPLGLPAKAVTVRVIDGAVSPEAEPYMGRAGAVGGYLLVEADSREAAVAIAARIPAARLGGAVEVRPCEAYW